MLEIQSKGSQFRFENPSFLSHRDSAGRETRLEYKKGLRLRVNSFTGALSLRGSGGRISLDALGSDDLGRFLAEFFRRWAAADRESATKAAFDYIDAQRGFVAIAFVASLLVALPVTVALLADSHQQFQCTRELEAHAVPGVMKVTKLRKVDSRNFNVNLEFTAPDGKVIKGQEVILTAEDVPPPMEFPFLYSPERPDCWSLTKTAGDANDPHRMESRELNWAKRRYFAWFGMLFGFFFLGVTAFGLAWSMGHWLRPRPFAKEVAATLGLEQ